jgi:hypothetical protein
MITLRSALAAVGLLACVTCAPNRYRAPRTQEETVLVVRNDNYLDHNIYLLVSGTRIRLGTARGLTTTRFVIPERFVFGPSTLQFMADPIGGRASPVSDRVNVSPGDEIRLVIPPA